MARNSKHKDAKLKRDGGSFFAIPASVLNGAAYLGLNAYAKSLLFDLLVQYRGDNNGDLCAAWKVMRVRGWKSEETLDKAKRALLESGLIVETRKGARPNKCSLYALTWQALDDCAGKLDMPVQSFPRGLYKMKDPVQPLGKITRLTTGGVVMGSG